MMVALAIGSSTFNRLCHAVFPIDVVASIVVVDRCCNPCEAIRMIGGSE